MQVLQLSVLPTPGVHVPNEGLVRQGPQLPRVKGCQWRPAELRLLVEVEHVEHSWWCGLCLSLCLQGNGCRQAQRSSDAEE